MYKLIYRALLSLIFMCTIPFFNCTFTYIYCYIIDNYQLDFTITNVLSLLSVTYIFMFIPALITGVFYGFLSQRYSRCLLLWLQVMVGGMIHFMSVVILDLLQPPTLDQILDIMFIMALLSIGSTLIVTFCVNFILKR